VGDWMGGVKANRGASNANFRQVKKDMVGRSMRKSKRGGRSYVTGGKKQGATKKHHRKANKTRRGGRKGSQKHAKKTYRRRRHRGGSGLIGQLVGSYGSVVAAPLQGVLATDTKRSQLKADIKKLESAQNAVAKDVQHIYKEANKAAASIVNKPGSGGAVAVAQQLANSQASVRGAYPNHSLVRP